MQKWSSIRKTERASVEIKRIALENLDNEGSSASMSILRRCMRLRTLISIQTANISMYLYRNVHLIFFSILSKYDILLALWSCFRLGDRPCWVRSRSGTQFRGIPDYSPLFTAFTVGHKFIFHHYAHHCINYLTQVFSIAFLKGSINSRNNTFLGKNNF